MKATIRLPARPPPAEMPSTPKSQPPRTAPMMPTTMSPRMPKPRPFISRPASQPAIAPMIRNQIKLFIFDSLSFLPSSLSTFAATSRTAARRVIYYPPSMSDLKLFNILTREKETFVPLTPGEVRMYSCGPTVYNHLHIGNMRTFVRGDVLRRYLEWRRLRVKQVMNITVVGDKIIRIAAAAGQ